MSPQPDPISPLTPVSDIFAKSAPAGGTVKAGGRSVRFRGVDPRNYRSAPVPAVRTLAGGSFEEGGFMKTSQL